MVKIGLVGVGFMGWIHYLAMKHLHNAELVAICSRDEQKLAGDWRSIRGNFGPPGEMVDLGKIKKYRQLEDMLADPEIDLIDVTNPTHLHPDTAIRALQAGKHVLVEKAISLTTQEADDMLAAASKANRLLMVAHVLPFFSEFKFVYDCVLDQRFGKLKGGHFKRIISQPDWSNDIGDAAKTGGPAVDLHIHDTHFVGLIAGVPQAVFSHGVQEQGIVQYLTTSYLYGDQGPAITCSSGALAMKARAFSHGFEVYFEQATLVLDNGPFTIFHANGTTETPTFTGSADPILSFANEIQTAVNGVIEQKVPPLLSAELARNALVTCFKEIESVQTGKIINIL